MAPLAVRLDCEMARLPLITTSTPSLTTPLCRAIRNRAHLCPRDRTSLRQGSAVRSAELILPSPQSYPHPVRLVLNASSFLAGTGGVRPPGCRKRKRGLAEVRWREGARSPGGGPRRSAGRTRRAEPGGPWCERPPTPGPANGASGPLCRWRELRVVPCGPCL